MIKKLQLINYRCFEEHSLPFRKTTVIVGKNNAGKSTVVEALRIISIFTDRIMGLNFKDVPDWLDLPRRMRGVSPSLKNLDINFSSIFHRYRKPPAVIRIIFNGDYALEIYVGPGELFGVILDPRGNSVTSKSQIESANIPDIGILPQIGPLARQETILRQDYVLGTMFSSLSSIHFRNQLYLFYRESFKEFKRISELSWPGLQIKTLEGKDGYYGGDLSLHVRDNDFVAEIGWMGHGLQMWLQIMWFLTDAKNYNTLILDEPDVYMHADLQRKLIRILKELKKQIIITTHSIEIMAEVDAENILVVDRSKDQSCFADSVPVVQKVIDYIGGIHNIQLSRLWSSKKLLIVEGNDHLFFKKLHDKLFPKADIPFDQIPHISIGGWGCWNYAVGSSMLLRNAGGESITTYCIFDSDFHIPDEIEQRKDDAKARGVQIHIWKYKEIENYLLVPAVILRVIQSKLKKRASVSLDIESIKAKINEIIENFKSEVFDNYADSFCLNERALGPKNANMKARVLVDKAWGTAEGRISIIPGKSVISKLSEWSQSEYGVSLSTNSILHAMAPEEINQEVKDILKSIEDNEKFPE